MQAWDITWELQRIKFYRGSLFKFFPAPLFSCIKLTLVPLWTVVTSVVLGEKKGGFFFLLLFGQKWLCYSAVLAQNALQGVSCVLLVFWLINSHEICSSQPDSLALSPAVGRTAFGKVTWESCAPHTHDHHVSKKKEVNDKIVKTQASFTRETIDLNDRCYFFKGLFICHKEHIFNGEYPLAKL